MSDRPSEGMTLDELREEFDWISEFQSRMAERICGDADVHNLVDYVGKLESENARLRELVKHLNVCNYYTSIECENVPCHECPYDNDTGNCDFDRRMRELGVVDQ